MRLWGSACKASDWFSWSPHSSHTSSQLLVSVYVQQTSMPPRGFSRASRRVLLTTSIWSAFLLVFAFFVTYTVVLICLEWPSPKGKVKQDLFPGYGRPRVRFLGRGFGVRNKTWLQHHSDIPHQERKVLWDPVQLDDQSSLQPKCKKGSLFVIIITSSPYHFQHRMDIRNSWCNPSLSTGDDNAWQCFFLVGQTNNTNTISKLRSENQRYRDVIAGSYIDSYRNLTYKVGHGFAWVSRNCEVPYVLKTDDDCFVNTLLLRQFLLRHNTRTSDLYVGNMVVDKHKRKVIRNVREKWFVSTEDYPPEYYPLYASGGGYILSSDVLAKYVKESKFHKPISNEDAFTGIIVDQLAIQPTFSGRFILSSAGLRLCNFVYLFVAHGSEPNMQQDMHNKMVKAPSACQKEEVITDWF